MTHPVTTILPHPELVSPLSKRDAAALRKLSDTYQVRDWTQRKVAKYKKYVSTLLAIHNSIAPINKLPTKILQKVFAYVPSEHKTWCDVSWMLSLQSVCRRWFSVLLATPEYWVRGITHVMDLYNKGLDSDEDEEEEDERRYLLDLFLARSAPCPLEITMDFSSSEDGPGWDALFEDHFHRVIVFEVTAQSRDDLVDILYTVRTNMGRLERFELELYFFDTSTVRLDQWQAEDLPHLGHLKIPAELFCCETTVPSLHTVFLAEPRDLESLPDLLAALERCPALATLRLHLASTQGSLNQRQTPERIVDLRNLRQLDLVGTAYGIYCFLSCVSFPSATRIDVEISTPREHQVVLPNAALPRRHSGLYASPKIDRLCLYWGRNEHWYHMPMEVGCVSMEGWVQGEERLRVSSALWLHSADHFLHFLDAFGACTLTELALDLHHVTSDMDGEFWKRFFAVFPHLRRLELLPSATADSDSESRATKRIIAGRFLAASRAPQHMQHGTSLAWALHADKSSTGWLEEELGDVEQVLSGHAHQGARLERLELYVTTLESRRYGARPVDVTQVTTDGTASRLVTRAYVSRLEAAADVVVVGGGWGFAEDDKPNKHAPHRNDHPTSRPHPELASTLPEADADALTELPDASQVRALTQRKIEEYKNHISTLLAIHNSIAPINILPTEIFQEIFAYVPSVSTWCDALWMLSLGSVCRQWHLILLATPEYWVRGLHTVMDPSYAYYHDSDDSDDSEDITRGRALFLARSAPWPLKISLEYSSCEDGPGWDAFEDHFDRVTVFEVAAQDADNLDIILNAVTSSMKRLERLQLEAEYSQVSTKGLLEWQAKELPCLGRLEITSALFCCATTVPSLHTVILTRPPRDIETLPRLLDALEKCPALATLRLELTHKDDALQNRTLKRVLDLPNLRNLVVSGGISDVRCFLSGLTFPSATLVELDVLDTDNEQDRGLVLPNVLPRRLTVGHAHQMLDGIDRLSFHSNHRDLSEDQQAIVSMRGYIQGSERLRISPAFWLQSADHFLRFLELFRQCRVTELVLDLRYATSDMGGDFWTRFFEALPDIRRLQLLSPTAESRVMKREIAKSYLASCGVPHLVPDSNLVNFLCRIALPRPAVSLAWVLCADQVNASQLDEEFRDVQHVLNGHAADEGVCLQRLELYITTPDPDPLGQQALDATEVTPDGMPSRMISSLHISGLGDAAEVVIMGSRLWELSENAELDVDGRDNEDGCEDKAEDEEDEELAGSSSSDS